MAGMSRDKCGSAVVAGFLQCVAKLKPKGLKVIGAMAMVRPIPLDNLLGRLYTCLLYTSAAADEGLGVDLGGRRII